MSFLKAGASAIGKLLIVVVLAIAFLAGLFGTVYLSLRGEELKVPEIVGKDYAESEKELAAMGLKIKRRADRFSEEKPNTVLEQLPRAGDTVKSGQMILVVVSKTNPEGTEAPATVKKDSGDTSADDSDDTLDPDKAKKSNKNANVKRPAQTTRDVVGNKANANSSTNSASGNGSNTAPRNPSNTTTNPANKVGPTTPGNKPPTNPTGTPKPNAGKTPATGGDTRNRKVP